PVGGQLGHGKAALLDHQPGPLALWGEPRLDLRLPVGPGVRGESEVTGRFAGVDPRRARPAAGPGGPDDPAGAQISRDLADPARGALGFGAGAPQVLDVGVVEVLDPHGASGVVDPTHAADDGHLRAFFPRAISVWRASSRCSQSERYAPSHSSSSASGAGRRL